MTPDVLVSKSLLEAQPPTRSYKSTVFSRLNYQINCLTVVIDLENSGLKKARDRKKHHTQRDWAELWFTFRDSMILCEMQ